MLTVGDVLMGRYRIDARLGAGGMATVYRARDLRLDRDVAVKALLPNLAADPVLAERFQREARAIAATAHPNVVAVYDVEPGDPDAGLDPFFVMELCDGGSLADLLAAGPMAPDALVPLIAAVADGLAALHERDVVHRDVKPHNILLSSGRPKLADFGLARSGELAAGTDLTATGTTVGTLAYLAPEALAGGTVGPAADVYGLGVVTFEGLTGRLPRPAASITALVEANRRPAPLVSAVAPGLGTAFDEAVAAALADDAAARPDAIAYANLLASGLEAAPGGVPGGGTVDPETTTSFTIPTVGQAGARLSEPGAERPARLDRWLLHGSRSDAALLLVGAFVLLVVGLAVLASLAAGPRGVGPAASSTASPTGATASPSPSRSAAASPSTVNAAAAALAALDEVDKAIAAAKGGGGLKGKDANELERLAGNVRTALTEGDFAGAREAAGELSKRVDELRKELGQQRYDRLRAAVDTLLAAIPAG